MNIQNQRASSGIILLILLKYILFILYYYITSYYNTALLNSRFCLVHFGILLSYTSDCCRPLLCTQFFNRRKLYTFLFTGAIKSFSLNEIILVCYLKPQPVPPRTMAPTRMAPAMEPMMMLVPEGPGGGGNRRGLHSTLL